MLSEVALISLEERKCYVQGKAEHFFPTDFYMISDKKLKINLKNAASAY